MSQRRGGHSSHNYPEDDTTQAEFHPNANHISDDEEDDVCCAKCGNRPEDVLILTCDHNLCLNCAAENLAKGQKKHQNTF